MSSCTLSPSGVDINGIVAAAAVGQDGAMADLMARIRPMVLGFCRSRLRGSRFVSPEDIAQEVCIAVMSALPRYQARDRFTGFVFGIASHKIVDALRAVRRDRSVPVDTVPEVGSRTESPEDTAIRSDELRSIESLLGVLPSRQRAILRLRIIEQRTAAETAAALHMTTGAVRVAQHRALNRLRDELASPSSKNQAWQQLVARPG